MRILIYFKEDAGTVAVKPTSETYSLLGETQSFQKPADAAPDNPWGQVPHAISEWCRHSNLALNDIIVVVLK